MLPEVMWLGLGLFLAGVICTLLAVLMLLKRRILLAGLNGSAGLSLLSMAAVVLLLLSNLYTYTQLTSEIELAEIEIGTKTAAGIPVKLKTTGEQQLFYINAAEWQLDARFLKWKPWAHLIGSEPLVRLETLSGRRPYVPADTTSSFALKQKHRILSELGSKFSDWLGIVDTYYGSSVYMPAVEGSIYSVSASISGLVARAENESAKQAVYHWMSQ